VSVVRGGKALLRTHGSLAAAGLTQARWRQQWESARLFLTADGEAAKAWGNETIRWHPDEGWLEIKLPAPLAHRANRPHGRYRLSCPVAFSYRGDEVAAQAASGAVRYDITQDPARGRWYIDASWKTAPVPAPSLDELRANPVMAIDVNHGHLAAAVIAPDGNVLGAPATIALALAGLPSATRDGRLRAAISALIAAAKARGARAIVIEDLNFDQARAEGREWAGRRPARGRRGRDFRRAVSGIPTGKFRLIGANGAGKTTTVECIQGLRKPDAGILRVLGYDPVTQAGELRPLIGSQLQDSALPDRLRVAEAVALFGTARARDGGELLERFGLAQRRSAR
jgi:ABC transporter